MKQRQTIQHLSGLLLLSILLLPLQSSAQSDGDRPDFVHLIDEQGYLIDGATMPEGTDLQGWEMTIAPDGRPRFHAPGVAGSAAPPLHPDDTHWSKDFGVAGIVGKIHAVSLVGCNEVYIGGEFREIGGVPARNVARWDGRKWNAVGEGFDNGTSGTVYALTVSGEDLYVGGRFDTAGGLFVNNIARFDGTDWHRVGYGVDAWDEWNLGAPGSVYALAVRGSNLYVGGRFDSLDTAPGTDEPQIFARNIGRWDGTEWHAMGEGLLGDEAGQPTDLGAVYDIAFGFDGIYAGGRFVSSGENNVAGVARFNGASWLPLGNGLALNNPSPDTSSTGGKLTVYSLEVKGPDVYVGGRFDQAGGEQTGNVALWASDYGGWFHFGAGSKTIVYDLALDGRRLYASGNFTTGVSGTTREVGLWEGGEWHPLGPIGDDGVDSTVVSVVAADGDVYLAGRFRTAGTSTAAGLALWSVGRRSWVPLNREIATSGGVNGDVYAVALTEDFLYVGGSFTTAGFVKTNSLARWSRSTGVWSEFGGGIAVDETKAPNQRPTVRAIAVDGSNVYIGGRFDRAGRADAYNVARWNGTEWSGLDEGIGTNYEGSTYDSITTVYALAAHQGILYVGGEFTIAGGSSANRIARWDEANRSWSTIGGGLGGAPFGIRVRAIAINGNDIYVGGTFSIAGSTRASNIARFDGSEWHALDRGINGQVNALTFGLGGALFAGGDFSDASGREVSNIAAWNGSTWSALGDGAKGTVFGLDAGANGLYVAGAFSRAGTAIVETIGRWDGSTWHNLGSGLTLDQPPGLKAFSNTVAVDGDNLFVGGRFTTAGGDPSLNIALWLKPGGSAKEDDPVDDAINERPTSGEAPLIR